MTLRLLISASVASLVVVGCPAGEASLEYLLPQGRAASGAGASWLVAASLPLGLAKPELARLKPAKLELTGALERTALRATRSARVQASERAESATLPEPGAALEPLARTLGALSKETPVYAEPRRVSRKLGFLRQGAVVQREPKPAGHAGCAGGWYRIAPEGYVCVGKGATLTLDHPVFALAGRRPDRDVALPYPYARARFQAPVLYKRIPSPHQQLRVEPDLGAQLARDGLGGVWDDVLLSELPAPLLPSERLSARAELPALERALVAGRALPETGFAFLRFFEHEGRRFGVTTDLDIVPLDRVSPVKASSFHGLQLPLQQPLPVAFTRSKGLFLYTGDPRSSGLRLERALDYREAVPLTGEKVESGTSRYLKTQSGDWILDKHLVRIDPPKSNPSWARGKKSWIEVDLSQQTLVAYEGPTPVYATLVSTGVGGSADPEDTHATIQGTFRIHTKHVTRTMNNDEVGDAFELRDVPYVQYFQDGYAFHAAYWHDSFGQPRSHGCVNLSPADARWLFHWSGPSVPRAWHSALSLDEGTLVYIHA